MSVAEKRRKQSRRTPSKKTNELIDIPKIVGQYPGLLALCLLSSLILGAAYFAAAPRVYESRASLLVETKHSPVFNEQTMEDRPSMEKTIDTHSIVITSPIILDQAIEDYGLDKLASLKEAENIVTHIQENMSVEIPDQDSSILELTFRGPSPEECQKVVEAVANTYQQYLGDSNQGVGTETTELI
ncbi:MAG: Wzz/FepE/Etk N-terminal domain-containing protein, partial [Planctomycetota bacterium]